MQQTKHEVNLNKIIARQQNVIKLAEQQSAYQIWCDLQAKTKQDFEDYLQQQSPDVQSMLLSYVDSCLMVSQ